MKLINYLYFNSEIILQLMKLVFKIISNILTGVGNIKFEFFTEFSKSVIRL